LAGSLFGVFSGIAIFIACLGLFGLATFMATQRTKEIGIRKVLGASIVGITGLLAKDFVKLVLIAVILASPLAYYCMQQWLADFAYHIEIQGWMFGVVALGAICTAFFTISFQSIKAALANPVKSLRNE
jgi:putative ABC transport system permease protein